MDKSALITILEAEKERIERRLKRREDDMPDWECAANAARRDTLNYALIQIDQLSKAA